MNNILSALSSWSNGGREPMDPNNSTSNETSTDRVDSPSSAERASKRRRRSPSCNDEVIDCDTTAKQLALPPEVWADVMEFLPFDMILTCAAVSRSMLETMPLITTLRIDKSAQMNVAVASRFRDVTDIHINSLLKEDILDEGSPDETRVIDIDAETKLRFVPFISRFGALERVYFGGKNQRGENIEGFSSADAYFFEEGDMYPYEASWDAMKGVIDMISAAFDTGAFRKNLSIFGLSCPNIVNRMGPRCITCERACKSFPLEHVVVFESKGSSVNNARSGRTHGLDVCLPMAEVESIIESRPGGKELLRSDSRLLRLLCAGRCWKIKSTDSERVLLFVKYTKSQLDEMKRVIQYAELDVKKLSAQKLQAAILNSFGNGHSNVPNCQRYLSESSLNYLKDELSLCVDMRSDGESVSYLLRYVEPIVQIVVQYFDENAPFSLDNNPILSDCLTLIRQFLELDSDAPIHRIARAIPALAKLLTSMPYPYDEFYDVNVEDKMEAAKSLNLFLTKGTKMHRRMVVNAAVVSKFSRLLDGWNDDKSIAKVALLGLVNIVDQERFRVDTVVNEGGIQMLIALLESSDKVCVKSSLRLLVIASNKYIQTLLDCGLVPHLFRMVLSHDGHLDCIPILSTLLRKVFESDEFPIQQAIDAIFIERLTKMLTTNEDETSVQTNLSFVCIKLALGANEENIDSLMKDTGLLPTLVRLQDSPIDIVSEKAFACLEHITNIRTSFEVEGKESLAWGEYRMLEIVDSDEESSVSYEEALEVSDEQVALEEQQALDANAPIYIYNPNADDEEQEAIPTLDGIPQHLLRTILIYATETQIEVNTLATVCKRFNTILDNGSDCNEFRIRHDWYKKSTIGLRMIRKFQKQSPRNVIIEVICERQIDKSIDDVESMADNEKLRAFATNLLAKMNHLGPAASFRLRGDTIDTLFELCQDYMVRRLQDALSMAIHCKRTEVQREDFFILPSQEVHSKCNVGNNYHGRGGLSFICSCSLPSKSGTIWRWPENDCRDVLPLDAGRRIIRRLAYKAGILQLTSPVFEVAEAELLHTLGVLLVEAYESSVESSKNARFLDPDDEGLLLSDGSCALPYGVFPDSMDMFYVSPPPLSVIEYDKESASFHDKDVHTLVPGQICAAAERRNIRPNKIYGGWTSTESDAKEMDFELGLYFKDRSDGDECPNSNVCNDGKSAGTSDGNDEATGSDGNGDLGRSVVAPPVAHANEAAAAPIANVPRLIVVAPVAAANVPQRAPARDALDALRAHPRFAELRRRYQNNFSSAQNLLGEILQQHPELREVIDTNQAAFYDLMSQ